MDRLPTLAADGASGGVDISVLTQYGVLGVFAILLILFARTSYKRETDRSDRLDGELSRLNGWVQDKAIPALLASARANEESQAFATEMYHALKEIYGVQTPRPIIRRPSATEDPTSP